MTPDHDNPENNSGGISFGADFYASAALFVAATRPRASKPATAWAAHAAPEARPSDPLSLRQAAAELHLSPRTLRDAVRRGELPASKLGARTLRVSRADIADWMRSRRVAPLVRGRMQ